MLNCPLQKLKMVVLHKKLKDSLFVSYMLIISRMNKYKTEIKWQFIVFGIYAIIGFIQEYSKHPTESLKIREVLGVLSVVISNCLLVNALANWLMLKYPLSKSPKQYFLYLFLIYGSYLLYRYLIDFPNFIDITNSYSNYQNKESTIFFLFFSTINGVITFLVALGLFSIKKSLRMERRARRLEHEVNEARLTILKHQFNPHFLYNTLSYMYAQARPISENLSKSILMLSDMMRYSLNKTEEKGLVLIEKEIEYIENFIEIHRLRFNKDFYLNFEIEGIIGNKKIVPLLLITFVENAIKHGVLNETKNPILVKISIENDTLNLFVKNKKQMGTKDETSGIGLQNTIKRLKLLYPQKHKLEINDLPYSYSANLTINIA